MSRLLIASSFSIAAAEMLAAGFVSRALKPGKEPTWNLIFPKGKWHGPNFEKLGGSFEVTDSFINEVIANWDAAGKPRLPVRWTHEHLKNTDPAKVAQLDRKAGNVIDLRATEEGLEGLTSWTNAGAKDIEDGVFDMWSAEWAPKHINRITGKVGGWFLSGVALTSEPYFNLMPPVAASTIPTDPTPQHQEGKTMNEAELKALRAKLGLAADATIEQINAKLDALTASAKPAPDTGAITAAVKAAVEPMQEQLKASQVEVKALNAKLLERDVDALVASAKQGDGQKGRAITDKQIARAKSIAKSEGKDAAAEFLNELPLTVPLTASSKPGDANGPLTQEAAKKKLDARANELRKEGKPDATLTAMTEMPDVALIADGRPTPNQAS